MGEWCILEQMKFQSFFFFFFFFFFSLSLSLSHTHTHTHTQRKSLEDSWNCWNQVRRKKKIAFALHHARTPGRFAAPWVTMPQSSQALCNIVSAIAAKFTGALQHCIHHRCEVHGCSTTSHSPLLWSSWPFCNAIIDALSSAIVAELTNTL
jgi:hypothetical protein